MPKKKKYKFEITKNGSADKPARFVFQEWRDADAIARFYSKLRNLEPGSVITLSRWDNRRAVWVPLKRGGKDPVKQSAGDLSGR